MLAHWLSSSNQVNTEIRSYYYLFLPAVAVCSKECAIPLNIIVEHHKISLRKLLPQAIRWPKFRRGLNGLGLPWLGRLHKGELARQKLVPNIYETKATRWKTTQSYSTELNILSLPDWRWFHNSATRFFPPSENSWPGEQDSVPPHKQKLCSAVTCHQRVVQAQQFCWDRVVWMQQGCTTQGCWTASIPLDGRESAATAGWFGNVDLIIPSHKRTGALRGSVVKCHCTAFTALRWIQYVASCPYEDFHHRLPLRLQH